MSRALTDPERAVVVANIESHLARGRQRDAYESCPTIDEPGVRRLVSLIASRTMVLRYERDMCDPLDLIDEVAAQVAAEDAPRRS